MAFINEKLTPEQREEFAGRGIKRPASHNISKPLFRTIDKETDMCLWHIGNLGRDDPDHHCFLFEFNEGNVYLVMKYSNPQKGSIIWTISEYEKNFTGMEMFAKSIKDALIVYGVDGDPAQHGITNVDVVFDETDLLRTEICFL